MPDVEAAVVRRSVTTLRDAVLRGGTTGAFVFHLEDGSVRLTHAELADRALVAAAGLGAKGVGPGDAVGILGPNRPEWITGACAAWLLGAAVVPLPIPLRVRDPDAFADRVTGLAEAAACRVVLAEQRFVRYLPRNVGVPWDGLGSAPIDSLPDDPGPDATAVIQFTSGSTASPKGAVISHRAVLAQMRAIAAVWHEARKGPNEAPRFLGWVPFFHDLGLVLHVCFPLVSRSQAHLLPTERFARRPLEWLRLVGVTRANITVAPTTAWRTAMAAAARSDLDIDLSGLRLAWLAAEGIDPAVIDDMADTGRMYGLRPEAIGTTYGLAEAVLAVATTRAGDGVEFDHVDVRELVEAGRITPAKEGHAKRIACCGYPVLDTEIRIVAEGTDVPDRHLGEVWVGGPSLMDGYLGSDDQPFSDDWLRTGDVGYVSGGKLYVTGRIKDIVIVMGHNYSPDDFEWAASRVEGVRGGRCIAFSRPETESVVVVAESRRGVEPGELAVRVKRAMSDSVGVSPTEVLIVQRGTIETTTSGKLRRIPTRIAYESELLNVIGRA